jgi:hypothetical protein
MSFVTLKVNNVAPPIPCRPYSVTSFPVTEAERSADAHMNIKFIENKWKVTFEWDVIDSSFASFYELLRGAVQFTVSLYLPARTSLTNVTMYRSELECGPVVAGSEANGPTYMKWRDFKVTFIEV